MNEEQILDVESTEIVPAPRGGMLLHGSNSTAKLAHAMEVATALADVIHKQNLYKNISGKKHVLVEGWELLGSLLGVFPVVEWTRQTENGWEARVVAKTLDGNEVGSAEMMCTRDENRWKTADDYAIRSMAQTRAISKALRGPLGFVMKLAGYEPTPEGEIPEEGAPADALPKAFDPETDLLPGAISGAEAPAQLRAALDQFDPTVDWSFVVSAACKAQYGSEELKSLQPDEFQDFWRRLSNAVQWIQNAADGSKGDFPPIDKQMLTAGFAYAFGGNEIEITYVEVPKSDAVLTPEQVAEVDEALKQEDIPFTVEEGDKK